jgi:hypothetical protein
VKPILQPFFNRRNIVDNFADIGIRSAERGG